jgi:two-component system chemotaxis sensor kinase CheA
MDDMDEVVGEFLVESYENLDQLDRDLLVLENDLAKKSEAGKGQTLSRGADRETLASVFRTIHTVKGTCGFLGFGKLEHVAHVGENLLAKLRDGELDLTPPMADTLLRLSTAVRDMLGEIERTGSEGPEDHADLIAALTELNTAPSSRPVPPTGPAATPLAAAAPSPLPSPAAPPSPNGMALTGDAGSAPTDAAAVETTAGPKSDTTIRVDVEVLDAVMDLVGELVLTRNRIGQLVAGTSTAELNDSAQRLDHLTTELQEAVTRTRMQPVGQVWARIPRVVRDLAQSIGKQLRVETEGDDTELDKSVVEAVKDPLTHMVRNAVDHGIEKPEDRVAAGKPAEGRLLLKASHQAGQVVIEIVDDGGGIDPRKIGAKAVEKGILSAADLGRMSEADVLQLIFAPGFSTAEQVTNVSGRGVGMDVVRTNIERIGGTVELSSVVGHGSTFTLRIPLTLAIMPALGITCGGASYAVPQNTVVEVVRVPADDRKQHVAKAQGAMVLRWRETLIPLVDLRTVLGAPPAPKGDLLALLVLAEGRTFALSIDGLEDTAEIVVKPLGAHLADVDVLAGATILGDGRISLILDILGLAQRTSVVREGRRRARTEKVEEVGPATAPVLVCRAPTDARLAIPLEHVRRLVEVPASAIEPVAGGEAVQLDGSVVPVVRVADLLGAGGDHGDVVQLVLAGLPGGDGSEVAVALLLGRVVDVLEAPVELEPAHRAGAAGSTVLAGRATTVADLSAILAAAGLAAVPLGAR